jgi:hypothetical protein
MEALLPYKATSEGRQVWTLSTGDEYQGELLDNLPHGQGAMKYAG